MNMIWHNYEWHDYESLHFVRGNLCSEFMKRNKIVCSLKYIESDGLQSMHKLSSDIVLCVEVLQVINKMHS